MQASINEFFAAIGSHWAGWKSVVVKTIACKTLDRWVNLGTTLTLSSQPVGEPAFFQRELPSAGILVLKQVHQADVLDQLVRDIDAGVLKFPGVDVCFGAVSSSQVSKQPLSWHFSILRRDDPFAWRRVPHCFHTLTANGERLQTLLVAGGHGTEHEVGAALAADAQPYDGLVDLFEEVLTSEMTLASPRRWRDVPDSSFVEILAPLPVVFSPSCRLSEGSLDLELQAPGYEYLVGVNVGVIERSGARTIRRYSIEVDKTGWKTERGVYTHAMSRVVDGATTVTVMLSVRGTLVEKRTLRDYQSSATNPRVAAYSHFDASQEALEKLLSGKGRDDGRRIEVAMAMLMHLLGFSVGPYGVLLAIPEEIDLLAFGRFNRRAIALECTLKDIDINHKLTVFARRVKELRQSLSDRFEDFEILPLVVTALSVARISSSDREKAQAEGIGIVAAEQLQDLVAMARRGETEEQVWAFLEPLIPSPSFPFGRVSPQD